jgi:hypothetical protein
MYILPSDVRIFRLVGPKRLLPRRRKEGRKEGGISDMQTRLFYKQAP